VTKLRFMSPAWVEMAREEITRRLATVDLTGVSFVLCEEFTNPPADLRRSGADTIGFTLRITDGEVVLEDGVAETCDLRVVSDYDEALIIARDPDAPAASPGAVSQRLADGRLRIEGDPAAAPAQLAEVDIHRLLSSRTA